MPVGDADFREAVSSISVVLFSWTEAATLCVEGDMACGRVAILLLFCQAWGQYGDVRREAETIGCCVGRLIITRRK